MGTAHQTLLTVVTLRSN